jgi:3-phenylpropionate/trans-cinnamate dioxygenase ferredoxin subunit
MSVQASTGDYIAVTTKDALAEGAMVAVDVGGKSVLIARTGGKFYAASNICPHMGGHLAKGKLNGTVVTCPRHGSQFDLTDGHNIRWTDWTGIQATVAKLFRSPRPVKTYPVMVEGNDIMIQIRD